MLKPLVYILSLAKQNAIHQQIITNSKQNKHINKKTIIMMPLLKLPTVMNPF